MALWSSNTRMWGAKTRPVTENRLKNGHSKEEIEDDMDDEDLIQKYKEIALTQTGEIQKLQETLKDRECEIKRLLVKLDENSSFLQKVVMELIALKAQQPPVMVPARTAMEKYLEKKNAEAVKDQAGPKGKLP